ncbi:MAG: hypothetical protein HXS40_08725 [Theionarchaea archaeon]|nr:hypothetical protein [Theionarchaea archaeon]
MMGAWGGPQRRVNGILGASLVSGTALVVCGLRTSIPLLAGALFVVFFTGPIANACSQAIWQVKTVPNVQGKVFAVRRMIALSVMPLSYLMAGPLADNVFEPLLAVNGYLAGSVGKILGTGPGRGIGLMIVIGGILSMVIVVAAYLYPRLRLLEDELPDMVDEDIHISAEEQETE